VRLLHIPGVHRPLSDTWLLRKALERQELKDAAVADLCTGSGALAIAAAMRGATPVVAADVSRRSMLATRINARLNGCTVQTRRADLAEALGADEFDVIVCNPPYIPAKTDALPRHRPTTPLDGGRDGRALLDRFCRAAPGHLRPGGSLLVVHSSLCGTEQTLSALRAEGLEAEVAERVTGELGPVLRARAAMLRERGLLGATDEEELVVVRGSAPSQPPATSEVAQELQRGTPT
jgi:release factor glutamine methyltransferase